jgi:fibro-slime domain-containing protein
MRALATLLATTVLIGCNTDPGVSRATGGNGGSAAGGSGGSGAGGSGAGGTAGTMGKPPTPPGSGGTGAGGAGGSGPPPLTGVTPADIGGWKLGDPITGDVPSTGVGMGSGGECNALVGVVRDFKGADMGGHSDFERFAGERPTVGLVQPSLGADRKPVYAGTCESPGRTGACPYGQQMSGKPAFDQWYRFADGVNKPYLVYFQFDTAPSGVATFSSRAFFPLDNAGWGNSGTDTMSMQRNFGFTTELHTRFKYNGGEVFTFTGDDDLWVFVNGKLAMDLGGLHPEATGMFSLDAQAAALGIQKGMTYDMDLFHAERHTNASNFRVDTNFAFVDCGTIIK